MYKCKNTSEEGVCQSRVYVNLAYMFRVNTCILITYINVSRIRVKKVYVSLECMSTWIYIDQMTVKSIYQKD